MTLSTDITTHSAAAWHNCSFDTIGHDIGDIATVGSVSAGAPSTDCSFDVRRAGRYFLSLTGESAQALVADEYRSCVWFDDATAVIVLYTDRNVGNFGALHIAASTFHESTADAGESIKPEFRHESANKGWNSGIYSQCSIAEIL